jgi:hypothetical protein
MNFFVMQDDPQQALGVQGTQGCRGQGLLGYWGTLDVWYNEEIIPVSSDKL